MTLKEIADEWFDKTVPYPVPDPKGFQGQCVQFIRWCLINYYNKPQWDAVVGAADFWVLYETDARMIMHFKKITNTPIFIPKEGDICVWNKNKGGGYGHIGIVYGNQQTVKMLTCLEQNWKPLKVSIVTHNYNDVLGFLRVKE
ncbi:MAG: CHAP domain-containing protein [Treponema sp.]|jgi:hypothetical protein|nr:CHAP domain-containing protein [Treponema sp.]